MLTMLTKTAAVSSLRPVRPTLRGLLSWVIRRDAAFREEQKMARLSDDARRDMGLPASGATRAPKQPQLW